MTISVENPPEEIDKAKREAEAAKKKLLAFAAEIEEREKRIAALPKEIEDIKGQIAVLERDIPKMAPGPLRTAAEMEFMRLERRLDRATAELERLTLEPKLAEEIKVLRREIELVAKDLGTRFARLEKAIAERVPFPAAEVERLRGLGEQVEAFRERLGVTTRALAEGIPLAMAWRRTYEEKLWEDRAARGEVAVTESFASARNKFEVLHHIPTSETYVRVTPLG